VLWRDITQIYGADCVTFSADTPEAERWMRLKYRGSPLSFELPAENAEAVAFRNAADAANFTTIVLMKRRSAYM
jgi:hypothetical protein